MTTAAPICVAGVDGCPTGWIVVMHPLGQPRLADVRKVDHFRDLLALVDPTPAVIAIDMPIGLPSQVTIGGRGADIAARKVLGARQSAIFAMPSRRAVMCENYSDACAEALLTSDPPRKISKQAFNLFAKIRQIDALMTPDLQSRVFEAHPEVAFWRLNGRTALATAKKIKSQPNPEGLAQRRALLAAAGYAEDFLHAQHFKRIIAGPDDVLDATANAATAAAIYTGNAIRFPDAPDIDELGLRMEIWG